MSERLDDIILKILGTRAVLFDVLMIGIAGLSEDSG
jgi:hypothetical protein